MLTTFESKLLTALGRFNNLLHAALAVSLVIASVMVLWEFSLAVLQAVHQNNIATGFLQALGTLFTVWTLSSLISAEIDYVKTGVFQVTVFIDVVIITVLRQLIVEPVQVATSELSDRIVTQHLLLLGTLLVAGLLYRLVSSRVRAAAAPAA